MLVWKAVKRVNSGKLGHFCHWDDWENAPLNLNSLYAIYLTLYKHVWALSADIDQSQWSILELWVINSDIILRFLSLFGCETQRLSLFCSLECHRPLRRVCVCVCAYTHTHKRCLITVKRGMCVCVDVCLPQGDGSVCFFISLNWHLIWQPRGAFDSGEAGSQRSEDVCSLHLTSC